MKNLLLILLFTSISSEIFAQISDSECAIGKIAALKKQQQNARLLATQASDNNIDVTRGIS